jgi:hypothetical protein
MKRILATFLFLIAVATALIAGASTGAARQPPKAPKSFFGIGPQAPVTPEDLEYMRAGRIGSMRVLVSWGATQPTARGGYEWGGLDQTVEEASRRGLRLLPFVYGMPRWLGGDERRFPIDNGRQRRAWKQFLKALVKRYGPGGKFWREHSAGVVNYQSEAIRNPQPIREWQIWNEVNFFYFAKPVSVPRYAKLLNISAPAIKSVDPGADVVLSGLFGEPQQPRRKGIDAADFLAQLYRYPGIERRFDSVALHPYAVYASDLEQMVEDVYQVTRDNRDRPKFLITEMGWGSQNNFKEVAFEQGVRGQVKQLKLSYRFMLENRRRLNLKAAYWFSWKDLKDSCSFCDSVGLFREGDRYRPKPAWHAFVRLSGGRARP